MATECQWRGAAGGGEPAQPLVSGGKRLDGRVFEEFRTAMIRPGVVKKAAGSAYAEFGNTKLMVAVYGPRSPERKADFMETGRLRCDVKRAGFAVPPGKAAQVMDEKDMSLLVQRALEPSVQCHTFPKAVVDVYISVVEADGAEIAVSVVASSVALALAGVELYDLVSCCRLSLLRGELLLDSSQAEEEAEEGSMLLAVMPQRNAVTQVVMQGEWSRQLHRSALDLASSGCTQLDTVMRS
eukprot:CAMPEP_0117658028 /NCGR_PEP_ID=MMETSP0804-20121206/5645_1 /TAXON_ID=1074897 /ORGANISM="Tetraselmis astigmatica, Strain CCMP880" /LENGTH=239 /DNA_ID=CAMNT_0005464521 /DNA_START=123 /DNA_END=839 /DNA_ORIENTATION=+